MKLLIQRLADEMRANPGTILVVGAGTGAEVPFWRKLASPHLVLVEAHPQQAEELARRVIPAHNEEVWPLAIVGTPAAHATLQILNNPLYSSLKTPQGLTRYYPNLRVVGQAEVAARSLSESIESLALDASNTHLLVVDAPGQAWDLLSATPARLLQSFACIIVRCGTEPLYAGDKGRGDIAELLQRAGFDVELDDPDAIYPQTAVLLKRNDIRVRITQLETQLRQREDEYAAQVKLGVERDARLQELTREQHEQANLVAQHEASLDKASRQLAEQHKLVGDRQAQLQKLTQERDEQVKLAQQYKAELDKVNHGLAEQQKSANDHQAQFQKLTQERDEQAKLAAQYKAELDKTNKQNQERGTRIAQFENERTELNQRQTRLNQEMIKAEAQIDLIKDVLLREPGL